MSYYSILFQVPNLRTQVPSIMQQYVRSQPRVNYNYNYNLMLQKMYNDGAKAEVNIFKNDSIIELDTIFVHLYPNTW